VYAARFPDVLDLMARWAPIAQAGVFTTLSHDLRQLSMARPADLIRQAAWPIGLAPRS
jgi:hypothetical protein